MEGKGIDKNSLKLPKRVFVGLVALQVVVILATLLLRKGSDSGDGDSSFSSIVPFWLIIMIPIIITRKNKPKRFNSINHLWILVGLASFVLLAMVLFLLGVIS